MVRCKRSVLLVTVFDSNLPLSAVDVQSIEQGSNTQTIDTIFHTRQWVWENIREHDWLSVVYAEWEWSVFLRYKDNWQCSLRFGWFYTFFYQHIVNFDSREPSSGRPAWERAEWICDTNLLVKRSRCYAILIRPIWPSHVYTNFLSISTRAY